MPSDFGAVLCAALFVLPGYIALAVANAITPQYSKSALVNLFNCMTYSLFLSLFLSADVANFANALDANTLTALDWRTCAGKAFIYASILGVVLGLVRRAKCFRTICKTLRINVNTSPTAWDFKFLSIDETKALEVTLKNGRVIHGKYDTNSSASSIGDEGDGIFLETVYEDAGDEVRPKDHSDGMYIARDEIQTVEFFDSGDDDDE